MEKYIMLLIALAPYLVIGVSIILLGIKMKRTRRELDELLQAYNTIQNDRLSPEGCEAMERWLDEIAEQGAIEELGLRKIDVIRETVTILQQYWEVDGIREVLMDIQENTEGFIGFIEINFSADELPEITYHRKFNSKKDKE